MSDLCISGKFRSAEILVFKIHTKKKNENDSHRFLESRDIYLFTSVGPKMYLS